MREIDNNVNNLNFKAIPKLSIEDSTPAQEPSSAAPEQDLKQVHDLKNMPAGILGKSQVPDPVQTDIVNFQGKPTLAAIINQDIEKYAATHTTEETLEYMDTIMGEFAPASKK